MNNCTNVSMAIFTVNLSVLLYANKKVTKHQKNYCDANVLALTCGARIFFACDRSN